MKALVAAIVLCAALAQTAALSQTMFRGDPARSGVSAHAAPRSFGRVKWSFPTGDRVVSSAAYHDGAVIFGSDDGNVYAIDAATGRQRWKHVTDGPVPSSPAVADGRVHVVSYDGRLYALDARDGDVLWTFATEGERRFEARGLHGMLPRQQTHADTMDVYLSSPLVVQGVVYFGSGDRHLYAVDAATGRLRWKFAAGDVVHGSPAYADGTVFFGSWDGRVYALDARSGQERWRFQAGLDPLIHNQQGFQSSPAVVGGVVYIGCRDSHLYALDARTGAERWRFSTGQSWVITSPAVSDGRVYFGTSDSRRYHVVDAATGKPIVQHETRGYVFSSPVVAGDVVLFGLLSGVLEARDKPSGDLLWDYRTEASKANAGWALGADGRMNPAMLFPGLWSDSVNLGTQRQLGVGSIFSTPLVVGGVVYVGSNDGYLYALE